MMDSRSKIELALLAGMLARDALDMLNIPNKAVAQLSMVRIVERMMALDKAIKALPEDR